MSGTGTRGGQIDKSLGRPPAPQGGKTAAEHQNYLKGYGTK